MSPVGRRRTTKPVKRKAVKPAAPKRTKPKAAKSSTPKRAPKAKRSTAKRKAPKRAARKPAAAAKRRVATKRKAATKRKVAAKRPVLRVVARPAKRPARPRAAVATPPAFAGAKAGASAKELALFELERARVAVHAALQGLGDASAETPLAPGAWSPRQVVLHLVAEDREALQLLESAYARNLLPTFDDSQQDAANAATLAALDHHRWDEARRLLHEARADLRAAFEAIPDTPAEVWAADHAVGRIARGLAAHDRHHADVLKAARVRPPAG